MGDLEAMERQEASMINCFDTAGLCTCCFVLTCPPIPPAVWLTATADHATVDGGLKPQGRRSHPNAEEGVEQEVALNVRPSTPNDEAGEETHSAQPLEVHAIVEDP